MASRVDGGAIPGLELISTIGFQGRIRDGLLAHPDRCHIVYGVGHNIIIKNLNDGTQHCLHGHSNSVSCLAMSKDGSLLASGQVNYMGFKAEVIIWDFYTKGIYGSYSLHKVKVEAVAFSCNGDLVISLGGQDCRNVMVWDVRSRTPLCGSPSCTLIGQYQTLIRAANLHNDVFVTAGGDHYRLWKVDHPGRRLYPVTLSSGQIKRDILCLEIDSRDEHLYCGTSSGDVLKVRLFLTENEETRTTSDIAGKLICRIGKVLNKQVVGDSPLFSMGVSALVSLRTGGLILGTGEGIVCRVEEKDVYPKEKLNRRVIDIQQSSSKPIQSTPETRLSERVRTHVMGYVSMITMRGDGHQFFVGTLTSEIYRVALPEFDCELMHTCHGCAVNCVAFPNACSELFATCSIESVRVWNVSTSQELLRITVPNMACNAVCFSFDGRCIISGWSDGKIRAHTPESGRVIYIINDAHQRGVTAIAGTSDSLQLVSGGGEGEVRIWNVSPTSQMLHGTMKEHKGTITSLRIKSNDQECVSSGADGSCIVWDLKRFLRIQVVFANTLFRAVCYGPEECQILTCGTDRKISVWEVLDGVQIRELDGSLTGAVNALDISEDCETFVSGGCDKVLRVWQYQAGEVTHVGLGHSDEITDVAISPGMKNIVSVSSDGAIFIWKFPAKRWSY